MSKKETLRQQLLEQTLGKNAKNRSLSSLSEDIMDLLQFQKTQLEELSENVSETTITKINKEMEKDFGVHLDTKMNLEKATILSIEDINTKLIEKYPYKQNIPTFTSFLKRNQIMEKKEASYLFYNYKEADFFAEMIALLYENGHIESNAIKAVDFKNYPNKNEIFYQDMYNCLYGDASIVFFHHIEALPKSFVQMMITLLKEKYIPLTHRYIEDNTTLKDVGNQLMKNTISRLIWKNKTIVLLSSEDKEFLSDAFGTPFLNVIDEINAFEALDKECKKQLILTQIENFKQKVYTKCQIKIEENLIEYIEANQIEDIDAFLEDLFNELLKHPLSSPIKLMYVEKQLWLHHQEDKISILKEDTTNFEEIDKELQDLIGLQDIKEYLSSLKNYYATLKKRKAAGKKTADVSKHMIFSGNPGTGKTTVARILAKYLKACGILESGHLIEVTRKDLVGQYVGHTAQLCAQVIQSAVGGVLFIDEAYGLYRGNNDSYGLEAIDTLVKYMEDYRDDFVVILAGYKKEMEVFLSANSGLRSRFANILHFKDYTGEEIYRIATSIAKGKDYSIDPSAKKELIHYFTIQNEKEGGNGRLARNAVEKAMIAHASRNSDEDILLLEDFLGKGSEKDDN